MRLFCTACHIKMKNFNYLSVIKSKGIYLIEGFQPIVCFSNSVSNLFWLWFDFKIWYFRQSVVLFLIYLQNVRLFLGNFSFHRMLPQFRYALRTERLRLLYIFHNKVVFQRSFVFMDGKTQKLTFQIVLVTLEAFKKLPFIVFRGFVLITIQKQYKMY